MSENRKNVLIVEDEPEQQIILRRFFGVLDYAVVGVANSPGQLQSLFDAKPEIVVDIATIDAYVPNDGDGYRAAAIVRSKFPKASIIAISGEESGHGDVYLPKPYTIAQLRCSLENVRSR